MKQTASVASISTTVKWDIVSHLPGRCGGRSIDTTKPPRRRRAAGLLVRVSSDRRGGLRALEWHRSRENRDRAASWVSQGREGICAPGRAARRGYGGSAPPRGGRPRDRRRWARARRREK